MPVVCKKMRGRWRLLDKVTDKVAKNSRGTPVDGGGSEDKKQVQAHATAVNLRIGRS